MTLQTKLTSISNFFIFNSTYGPREGEEENKILFYFPENVDIDTKIKCVGLIEAVLKFTKTFTDKPCKSLHTLKTRQLFLEPEPDFWFVMTLTVPYSEKTKDGQTCYDYHEEDVHDHIYEATLWQAYKMFQFFHGSIKYILKKSEVEGLKMRFGHFYKRYLLALNVGQSDILTVFNGIHFLPLDKKTYLKIQCFINLLEASFPLIKYTVFLYNNQLVWNGLNMEDMRVMYHYLTTSLLPNFQEHELQTGHSVSSKPVYSLSLQGHYGKFVCGPPNVRDTSDLGKIPRVFVNVSEENEECFLFVYKALSAYVCMLFNSKESLPQDIFTKLDSFLGPQLTALASDIGEQYTKKLPPSYALESQIRYVYFNHMNLAQKTTLHIDRKSIIHVPSQVMHVLNDISSDLVRELGAETIVKTSTDYWVVGKKSDKREFYVVLNQKNANLIEINEEVKKLCSNQLSSIFFLD